MKKVRFTFSSGYVGSKREEIIEFEDDADEKEIEEVFSQWLWETSDANWYYID